MEYNWVKLPLYDSWDYKYNASIGTQSVDLRIYYNDRNQTWSFSAAYSDGENIIQGSRLIPLSPMTDLKIRGLQGFLWLEPISQEINETVINPEQLQKYYNLYYISY